MSGPAPRRRDDSRDRGGGTSSARPGAIGEIRSALPEDVDEPAAKAEPVPAPSRAPRSPSPMQSPPPLRLTDHVLSPAAGSSRAPRFFFTATTFAPLRRTGVALSFSAVSFSPALLLYSVIASLRKAFMSALSGGAGVVTVSNLAVVDETAEAGSTLTIAPDGPIRLLEDSTQQAQTPAARACRRRSSWRSSHRPQRC